MKIKVKLVGLPPGLLMHRFGEADMAKATSGAGRTAAPQDEKSPRAIAESYLYTHDGKPVVPATWLLGSWRVAGRDFKIGKRQVSTAKSSIVPAAVFITDDAMAIKPGAWEVDSRPVTIPATGGKILRHRPRFDKWELSFEIELDTDMISQTMMREIVDAAGKKVGIGDFRPTCGGPFGRYRVDEWTPAKS